MSLVGRVKRVRVYVSERDKVHHRPASDALLEFLRHERAHGATVFRSAGGFGSSGTVHVPHLVDVAQDLPILLEWLDSADDVQRLLPRVVEMVPGALITIDETEIVHAPTVPPR